MVMKVNRLLLLALILMVFLAGCIAFPKEAPPKLISSENVSVPEPHRIEGFSPWYMKYEYDWKGKVFFLYLQEGDFTKLIDLIKEAGSTSILEEREESIGGVKFKVFKMEEIGKDKGMYTFSDGKTTISCFRLYGVHTSLNEKLNDKWNFNAYYELCRWFIENHYLKGSLPA